MKPSIFERLSVFSVSMIEISQQHNIVWPVKVVYKLLTSVFWGDISHHLNLLVLFGSVFFLFLFVPLGT